MKTGAKFAAAILSATPVLLAFQGPGNPPQILTSSLPNASVGVAYSANVAVDRGNPPYLFLITAGSLPPGLSIGLLSGGISGTPRSLGSYLFTVRVIDSRLNTDDQLLSITVAAQAAQILISPDALPPGAVGTPYGAGMTASGGTPPYIWSVTAGALPGGLFLIPLTGQIAGTPTVASSNPFTIGVTDAAGGSGSRDYVVTINPAVAIAGSGPLPNGVVGFGYSTTLSASGGAPPYTWSVANGSLPGGLALDQATGTIGGTPTAAGTSAALVLATDSQGASGNRSISITIAPPVAIAAASLPQTKIGDQYQANLSASGGWPPYTWSLAAGSLPQGLQLSSAGAITGTVGSSGTFNFTAAARDSIGAAAQQSFSINVIPPLAVTTTSLPDGTVGLQYSASVSASGGLPPVKWSIASGSLPQGLSLNDANGQISGTPSAAGASTFTVQATDAAGQTATRSYTVTIRPPVKVDTTSLPNATVGRQYSAGLTASGGAPSYSWSVDPGSSLPAGLSLNSNSGRITGSPGGPPGTASFTVRVTDSGGGSATANLSITVNAPLVISTSTLPGGVVGVAYAASLSATGGVPPYSWSVSGGSLPAGLNINATSGEITGTPSAAGTSNFTVRVADQGGSATANLSIAVTPAVSVTTTTLPGGVVGSAYSASLAAAGGVPPYAWAVASGSLPQGLTLAASGQITGTPAAAGNSSFTVRVTDSAGGNATANLGISIGVALSITTGTLPGGTVGAPYGATLAAAGGTPPYAWSVESGSLPAGLSLSPAGEIAGTPASAGSSNFTARVADQGGAAASQAFTIVIAAALSITTPSLPDGSVGSAYLAGLSAAGGAPPYAWSITSGSLPAGLSLNASAGAISGIPSAAGAANFTVQVADSGAGRATQSYTISIAAALAITTGPLPSGIVGSAYSTSLAAAGGAPPYTWSIPSGSLPPGLSLNASSGGITGTPSTAGAFSFTAQVADASQNAASSNFAITIADPAPPPLEILSGAPQPASFGVSYTFILSASGGRPPYRWTIEGSLPPGLTLNSTTGEVSGTPTASGTFPFTARVDDSRGFSTNRQYTITVQSNIVINAPNPLPPAGVGTEYSVKLEAVGGAAPYRWTVTNGTLPAGISLNETTGVISGSPDAAGNSTFTVQVTDSANLTATRALSIAVTQNLTITSTSPLPPGAIGTQYSQALAALAGAPPYRWSVSTGSLPAGLSLNQNTGVISGTPTSPGNSNFTIRVTDNSSNAASKSFALTIVGALTVTTTALPNAMVGTAYSQTLAALAGTSPYSWSVTSGSLPSGLSLDGAAGRIAGTPDATGRSDFTIQVRDAIGATASRPLSLTVAPALTISTTSLPPGTAGAAYNQTLSASGGTPPYAWALVQGTLPAGLTLDAAQGMIGGTPNAPGEFQFSVQVADASRTTSSAIYTLNIGLSGAPEVLVNGLPATAGPLEQPRLAVALREAFPVDISGRLTLTFQQDAAVPSDDPSVQFSTGGRTLDFTVPANSTEAVFATTPALQTGSVSGTITITARLTAGGVDATPSPPPSWTIRIERTAPVIRSVRLVRTGAGFEVWVTGLSPARELTQATFRFSGATGSDLQTSEVTIPLTESARQWYQDSASRLFGSQFTLVQPFTIQGNANAVASVSVTLTNAQGASQAASATF